MSPDSNSRRGRGTKRRKLDTPNIIVIDPVRPTRSRSRKASTENSSEQHRPASLANSAKRIAPVVRPPDAPFLPNAIRMWVTRDAQGKKKLTSEMVPGCWHWRIGDPNVPFCCECNKEDDDILGCRTCKKSYHLNCLGEEAHGKSSRSRDAFYCPLCIERGWNTQPPPEILPLTPAASRESSPAPPLSTRPDFEPESSIRSDNNAVNERHELAQTNRVTSEGTSQGASIAVNDHSAPPTPCQGPGKAASSARPRKLDSRAAAFMSTYNLEPPPANSASRNSGNTESASAAARINRPKSRYQTMPDEVDQALTVIYRELESVTALRQEVTALRDQVRTAEQARQISEGRLALQRSGQEAIARKDAEIESLKRQLVGLRASYESAVQENDQLKQRMLDEEKTNKAGLEEMQALKTSLRRLLGE